MIILLLNDLCNKLLVKKKDTDRAEYEREM